MPIVVPAAIAALVSVVETALAPINIYDYCATLDALVPDVDSLSPDERRGYFAEVQVHRFVLTSDADRGPWGIGFGPSGTMRMADGTDHHGPDARGMDREMVDYWADRARDTPHAVLRARYADLSREMSVYLNRERAGERLAARRDLAQLAATAYLEVVSLELEMGADHAWIHLERAASLAIAINDSALTAAVKAAVFARHNAERAAGDGPWWAIDNLTARHPKLGLTSAEDRKLVAWLDEVLDACTDSGKPQRFDAHAALCVADALIRRHGAKGREKGQAALRKAGSALEAIAAQADGMLEGAWLQTMSQRYRSAGLDEDADRVDLRILSRAREEQARAPAAHSPSGAEGGTRPDPSVQRRGGRIAAASDTLESASDTDDAIIAMLTEKSGTDSLARIARHLMAPEGLLRAAQMASAARPCMDEMFPIEKVDGDGFTAATIGPAGQDLPGRMVFFAAFRMMARSPQLDGALQAAVAKWDLDAAAIVDFLCQSPLFLLRRRGFLAAGVEAWFAGDDMKAIHILVPQVEAAVREMLIAAGASPMKRDERDGGFQSLGMGAILVHEALIRSMDPTLRLHLRSLYTSAKGHNLRNELAHGFATPAHVGRGMADWVVHSLLAIRVAAQPFELLHPKH